MDDDYLRLIERSGCLSLVIGVESGCQRIADVMRKGIDVSQAVPVNRRLTNYRMEPRYPFLLGIPGETAADMAESAALILKLVDENRKATTGIQIFVPYPGTELHDLAVQHGLPVPQRLEEWVHFSWANRRLDYPWLSPETRRLLQMIAFSGLFLPGDRNLRVFSEVSAFVSLVARLYRPAARKRVRGLHYRFMPELRIAELLGFKGY
jgi:radical SAM superfamily enzyme YgiQ (UPF0313 family)